MRLTDREARIRAGEAGEAPRLALEHTDGRTSDVLA